MWFVIPYWHTDENDWTDAEAALMEADSAEEAHDRFISIYVLMAAGEVWHDAADWGSSAESSGDDVYYIVGSPESEDDDEPPTAMIAVGDPQPYRTRWSAEEAIDRKGIGLTVIEEFESTEENPTKDRVTIVVGEDDWNVLEDTLIADASSPAIDRTFRNHIRRALDAAERSYAGGTFHGQVRMSVRASRDDWYLLQETLHADIESPRFDPALRRDIRDALGRVSVKDAPRGR